MALVEPVVGITFIAGLPIAAKSRSSHDVAGTIHRLAMLSGAGLMFLVLLVCRTKQQQAGLAHHQVITLH